MNDWNIHRREERCARCQLPFQSGQAIFSLLFFDADRLRREDRCQACFPGTESGGAEGGSEFLFWRTLHRPDARTRFAVDFEAIEELFLGLEGRSEERLLELRYLLALLLLRKKRLKLVGVRRHPEGESLCVRRPRRQEEFEVAVFELDSARAAALKAELARVFEGAGVEALLASPQVADEPDAESPVAQAGTRDSGE